jgi:hypothetical protein
MNVSIYYVEDIVNKSDYNSNFIPENYINIRKHGQIKLLLNEIRFLSQDVEIKKYDFVNVLYIGSGKGYHLPLLISLYKQYNINWYFYDPIGHCRRLNTLNDKYHNIHVYDKMFTDLDTSNYINMENLLFISDIRTLNNGNKEPTTENLLCDYELQNIIIKKLKPMFSLIKFRMPFPNDWNDKNSLQIPVGKQYIQVFQKHDSNEFRIFLTSVLMFEDININKLIEYENKFAWYNQNYRFKYDNDIKIAIEILNIYFKSENNNIFNFTYANNNNIKKIIYKISNFFNRC